jgi:SAM-dependent methyltransferase
MGRPDQETRLRLNTAIHVRVMENLDPEVRGRVVDLGAGDGYLAGLLREAGFDVRALDRVATYFAPTDIPLDQADLNERLPYSDGEFDAAVATELIEHIENPWFLIREMHRIIRPGGVAVISTPNVTNLYTRAWYALSGQLFNFMESSYRDIGHITPVPLWNLRRMVEGRFDIEAVDYNANWLPKTRIVLPGRSGTLGQCLVVKLRRLEGDHDAVGRRWASASLTRKPPVAQDC